MAHTWLRFGEDSYPLPGNLDLEALKGTIAAAVRSGGQWVEFDAEDGRHVRLFASRGSVLVLEEVDPATRVESTNEQTGPHPEILDEL